MDLLRPREPGPEGRATTTRCRSAASRCSWCAAPTASISVLYNRCPHRGNMMCGDRHGNTGEFFRCSYHAWTFHHDGRLKNIPMMESAYSGTRFGKDNPDCSMKRAARVETYRGFVFASLAPTAYAARIPRRIEGRVRRHVRPRARGRGRGGAELLPRHPALELEDLPREPARRAAPLGDAPVHRARGARSREAAREEGEKGRGAALLPHALRVRDGDHRQVGQRSRPSTTRTATASSPATWACGRRTPTPSPTTRS